MLIQDDVREYCDLSLLFEDVKCSLANEIDQTMAKVFSGELPHLHMDRLTVRELLQRLIGSSIRHRSVQKPIIILRHALGHSEHCFSIEDNGTSAFERFDGGAGDPEKNFAWCKQLMETNGGRMWLDESYKAGCRICFTIPA